MYNLKTSIQPFPSYETHYEIYWRVTLNNGSFIYRTPNIDNNGSIDSWLVLKEYLACGVNHITGFHFFFRDHWEEIGLNKDAFFFTKMVKAHYGGSTQSFYLGGYLNENRDGIFIKKFIVPEFVLHEEETRPISDHTLEKGLIWRRY
jgi:hypothetical protein